MPVAGVDDAIAIALQPFRLGFPQSAGQESRRDAFRADVEPHDTFALAIDPELRHREEIARRRRKPSKTTRGLFLQIFEIFFIPTSGDATIDFKPHSFRLDVIGRQHIRDRQIQIGHPETGCSVAGLLRSQFQKMAIQHGPEDLYMARLLLREEISRSSEVEISLADGEARARPAELFENGQTLLGMLRIRFGQEMREGAHAASSHTSPELMELGEAEFLGPANDDGVRPGDVKATLYDIGRQENVRLAFDKPHHPVVDLIGGQLAMETDDAKIRSRRLNPRQRRLQILNARADQETLSVASLLAQQCRN